MEMEGFTEGWGLISRKRRFISWYMRAFQKKVVYIFFNWGKLIPRFWNEFGSNLGEGKGENCTSNDIHESLFLILSIYITI